MDVEPQLRLLDRRAGRRSAPATRGAGTTMPASGEGPEIERITHRFDTFPDPMPDPLVTLTTGPGLAYPGRHMGAAMNLSTNHGASRR